MSNILQRDINGHCEGECRNTIHEGEQRRQRELESMNLSTPDSTPSINHARSRNEAPGWLGGHM